MQLLPCFLPYANGWRLTSLRISMKDQNVTFLCFSVVQSKPKVNGGCSTTYQK